jgi:menaquinone-dependent protoporphyrinogen oxidase
VIETVPGHSGFYSGPVHHVMEARMIPGRVLVAFATRHGSTAGVADAVASELTVAGFEARTAALPTVNSLEGYDGAVLGAPLYMGTPLDLSPFVTRYRDTLARMPVAAFAVGLTPAAREPKPEQVELARNALIDALSPIRPVAAALFAGAIDPAKMGLVERAATWVLGAPRGDFRDWDAIGAWARSLVPLLLVDDGVH